MDGEQAKERVKVSITIDGDLATLLRVHALMGRETQSAYVERLLRDNLTEYELVEDGIQRTSAA